MYVGVDTATSSIAALDGYGVDAGMKIVKQ
jgi:hypothetical protein